MFFRLGIHLGIHAFFGAFISGLCIPRKGELTDFLGVRIELIVVEFFLPYVHNLILPCRNNNLFFSLYFANSGLQTHLNLLNTGKVWWTLVVLLILASTAKIVPVTLMSKLVTKKPWRYCLSIGVLMNTRGIVQLVVLNIGVQLGVLSPIIFALFVLMATILTFLTSPILYLLCRKDFDTTKLSMDTVAEDLQLTREDNMNMNQLSSDGIQTISNGDIGTNEQRSSETKFIRQSSSNLPAYESLLTVDERINYPELNPNVRGEQLVVIGNIVTMPTCPTRSLNMTRF